MDEKLQELVTLQREQNELLKRYLWRLRFSLLGLLLLTTGIAIGLGFVAYQTRPPVIAPFPAPAPFATAGTLIPPNAPTGTMRAAPPIGDVKILPVVPSTG